MKNIFRAAVLSLAVTACSPNEQNTNTQGRNVVFGDSLTSAQQYNVDCGATVYWAGYSIGDIPKLAQAKAFYTNLMRAIPNQQLAKEAFEASMKSQAEAINPNVIETVNAFAGRLKGCLRTADIQ